MKLTRVAPTRHPCLETDLLKYQYCTIYREKMKNVLKICYCVALPPQKLIINPSLLTHNSFALNIELLSTRKLFKNVFIQFIVIDNQINAFHYF